MVMDPDIALWIRARGDLLNALIQLAAAARNEREVEYVRATVRAGVEVGLFDPVDGESTDTLARARLQVLQMPGKPSESESPLGYPDS